MSFGWLGIAALIDLKGFAQAILTTLWMAGNRGFDRLRSRLGRACALRFGWLGIAALIDLRRPAPASRRCFGWLGIAALIDLEPGGHVGASRLWMAGNRGFDRLAGVLGWQDAGALDGWESRL